jgi:hypothetical protein
MGRRNIHSNVGPLVVQETEVKNCPSSSQGWWAVGRLVGGVTVAEQWFM